MLHANMLLVEGAQIVPAFPPIDMSAGANTGDWVDLANFDRCTCILFKSAGTAGDDAQITLQQATDATGSNAKALNFTRIDQKVGTLTAVGAFTTVIQAAANTYKPTNGASQAIEVVEFQASDLDVNNGFNFIQMSVPKVGTNAQIGSGLYILRGARYGGADLPSAIV